MIMSKVLEIIKEPDKRLHQVSHPVDLSQKEAIKDLIDNMFKTMYENRGIGLAAVQVGILKRLVVIDVSDRYDFNKEHYTNFSHKKTEGDRFYMINPKILYAANELSSFEEGCLSFSSIKVEITRPSSFKLEYYILDGTRIERDIESGLLAVCIQHEIDHLEGILFIDYLQIMYLKSSVILLIRN